MIYTALAEHDIYFIVFCKSFQPRSGIHRVRNRRCIQPVMITGNAHDQRTGMHANADPDRNICIENMTSVEFINSQLHFYCSCECVRSISRENGHDRISQVLIDESVMFAYDRPDAFVE